MGLQFGVGHAAILSRDLRRKHVNPRLDPPALGRPHVHILIAAHVAIEIRVAALALIAWKVPSGASSKSPVGQVVYYLPKWGFVRCLWSSPDKELKELISGFAA
jgi:hypothetical protein